MILLSIHPEYVEKILAGTKTFEYRKRIPNDFDSDRRIAVYATSPVGRIVAYLDIKKICSSAPSALWRKTSRFSGLDKATYDSYFSGRNVAYAFVIEKVHRLSKPVTLHQVGWLSGAPQSFVYLNQEQISKVKLAADGRQK